MFWHISEIDGRAVDVGNDEEYVAFLAEHYQRLFYFEAELVMT